jgi:hypothetical protein
LAVQMLLISSTRHDKKICKIPSRWVCYYNNIITTNMDMISFDWLITYDRRPAWNRKGHTWHSNPTFGRLQVALPLFRWVKCNKNLYYFFTFYKTSEYYISLTLLEIFFTNDLDPNHKCNVNISDLISTSSIVLNF